MRFDRFPNTSGISPSKLQLTNFLQNSKMGKLIDKMQVELTNWLTIISDKTLDWNLQTL